jgi:FlaG protein
MTLISSFSPITAAFYDPGGKSDSADPSPPQTPLPVQPSLQSDLTSSDKAQSDEQQSTTRTQKRIILDQATGSLVYQVIDQPTGQTISQSPDEAILRVRAYAKQMERAALQGIALGQDSKAPITGTKCVSVKS